jgi:hypothetical protein
MRHFFFLLIILLPQIFIAQNKSITGVIKDSLGVPLPSANIMASPTQKERALKFSIADADGRYKLVLENNTSYTISVSYMGFDDENFIFRAEDNTSVRDFILKRNNEQLQEIIIKYDVKPIVVKKDTIVYNVDSFTNGSERKLKEQLKKLPGVEVDRDGNVTLQGKRVTTFLVENDPFFGGGSKLGVENIPADAVDKVEFIDHFNEVAFLKEVSGSQQLALNIKLKKDKKNFLFGDIEGASGVPDFYKLHSGLFYYGGQTTASYIGNLNNIGDSTLDFADIIRFSGGSTFLDQNNATEDLFAFASDNRNVVRGKSQFSAANFTHRFTPKSTLSAYVIGSRVVNEIKNTAEITYFQNEFSTIENRLNQLDSDKNFFLGRLKFNHKASNNEQWSYDANFKLTDRNFDDRLTSKTPSQFNEFVTLSNFKDVYLNQFVEWHKSYSDTKTTTLVVSQKYEDRNSAVDWQTNQPFLTNFLPLLENDSYDVNQLKRIKNNSINALFKFYWIVNDFSHLYFVAGNTFIDAKVTSKEQQILSDNTTNDFFNSGFGNDMNFRFNDTKSGIEYKFLFKKWTTKASLYVHHFNLFTQNNGLENQYTKNVLQPQLESEIELKKGETVTFNYRLTNEFSDFQDYTSQFQLQNYQSVFRGNPQLTEQRQNSYSLFYKKTNLLQGYVLNLALNYSKRSNAVRNELIIEGINQFTTPVQNNIPEENALFRGTITKNVYKFNVGFNSFFTTINFIQPINGERNFVTRNATNWGVVFKTADKNWPFITLKYNRSFDEFKSVTASNFHSDRFSIDYDVVLKDVLVFKAFHDYQSNYSTNSTVTSFHTTNFSIGYQPLNSAWKFELDGRNIFGNSIINSNSFSAFSTTNQTTFILPRIILLSATFKL